MLKAQRQRVAGRREQWAERKACSAYNRLKFYYVGSVQLHPKYTDQII
jgi:hypothetical protein